MKNTDYRGNIFVKKSLNLTILKMLNIKNLENDLINGEIFKM